MKQIACLLTTLGLALAPTQPTRAADPQPIVRLYALDCGRIDNTDLTFFSDTGEHAGERGSLIVPCYLIRDGDRWLLWDTGLGDALAATPQGAREDGERWSVPHTLVSQLARLGLKPDDVTVVALSHLHFDHAGNVGLFIHSTVLIGAPELAFAKGNPPGTDPKINASLATLKIKPLHIDEDVFGDGRVVIFATPGHTPGHRSLLVRLPKAGAVMLSGDLWHSRENHEKSLVPQFNASRADTLASFDRFRHMAERYHARVIIQHAPQDFAALPAFPAYLD